MPVVLAVAMALGCAGHHTPSPLVPRTAASEFFAVGAGDRLYYNDGSAITDSLRAVIRTAADWTALWQRINANQSPAPAAPTVDFTQRMLIVVAAGPMNTGDRIRIDSVGVGSKEKTLSVVVRTVIECHPLPGTVYPLEIVQVQKSDALPVWLDRREKPGCS
jgi:hypothetical protein